MAIDFEQTDPERVDAKRQIYDIPSLYAFVNDKRHCVVQLIQNGDVRDPAVVEEAANFMEAALRAMLKPAPDPRAGRFALPLPDIGYARPQPTAAA